MKKTLFAVFAGLLFSSVATADPYTGYNFSGWLGRIGVTQAIQNQAMGGRGITIGIVDTGIVASNFEFSANRNVLSTSECAAVIFRCTNGVVDDNGHGTAVAALAAGNFVPISLGRNNVSMVGVAPNAFIQAEKALGASGFGTDTDIANGIVRAVNNGARIINISATFSGSTTIVNAVNYAAARDAIIVYAGGNNNTVFARTVNGLTTNAVKHLVFVGSLDGYNRLSDFSNTPGAATIIDTAGNRTQASASWLMAPGSYLYAPTVTPSIASVYGNNYVGSWSGTSMSAPLVSGSLALLQSTWPVLRNNAAALDLLEKTSTRLGSASVYGYGVINLTAAFRPYGGTSVMLANSSMVSTSSLSNSMIMSGALGDLANVTSRLSSYPVFDSYLRNFTQNLSYLVTVASTRTTATALASTNNVSSRISRFSGGTTTFGIQTDAIKEMDLKIASLNDASTKQVVPFYSLTKTDDGNVVGMGYGFNANNAYVAALYGDENMSRTSAALNVVSNLNDLTIGGAYLSTGFFLNNTTRFAVSLASTQSNANSDWNHQNAKNLSIGFSSKLNDVATVGVSFAGLNEQHGLLGSVYNAESVLGFGNMNKTNSIGVSAGFNLGSGATVMFETSVAKVAGNTGNGIISNVSGITAKSFGVAFNQVNFAKDGDSLTLSIKQPLRVTSGSASLLVPDVDSETGAAIARSEVVSLVPTGRQTDYGLSYTSPVSKKAFVGVNMKYTTNENNIAGHNSAGIGVTYSVKF